jgi:outer membrane immunogenic protein
LDFEMTIVSCGRLALVVAWSLTSLGVASAADIPAKAPVYKTQITEAVSNWSGFYVGAGLGFRSSQTDVNVNSARNTGNPAVLVDQFLAADCLAGLPCVRGQQFNGTAFRASPYLGYNWQMNSRWVLGIEADAGFGDQTTASQGDYPATPFLPGGSPSKSFSVKTSWDASVRGRAGYLAQPDVLLYATAGPAWLHVESTSNCSTLASADGNCIPGFGLAPASIGHSTTKLGATVGGGVEAMLSPNWIVRGEYRYSDFGPINNTDVRTSPAGVQTVNYDVKIQTHTATFGLAYKFGEPAKASGSPLSAYAAMPAATSWTGAYIGAGVGAHASQANAAVNSAVVTRTGFAPVDTVSGCECFLDNAMNGTSFRFNPYLGYNWQFAPKWVVGIEGDFGWANQQTTISGSNSPGAAFFSSSFSRNDSYSIATKWDASVRLRLGYVVNPSLMVYGTAGPAWLKIEETSRCDTATQFLATAPGFSSAEFGGCAPGLRTPANIAQSTIRPGLTVGGGGEMRLWSNWIARAEYRYSDFGTAKFNETRSCAGSNTLTEAGFGTATVNCFETDALQTSVRVRTHAATFGIAYKFD